MSRSVVQQFHSKLGAVGLFIDGIADAAERVRQSSIHSDTLIAFLQQQKTTKADRDNCMALVVDDPRLEQEDRRRLLTAIAAGPRARQDGQKWSPQILNIFTSTDWDNWKRRGAEHADDTLDDMIMRIQNLGGKNISEPDKKLVTAAWLYICDLGENAQRRAILKQQFKTRFDTLMRGFTPKVYMTKLLPMEEVKALHPTMFNRAYTEANPPIRMPEEHYMGVMTLNAVMNCRGGGGGIAAARFATEAQGATAWMGQQPFALTAGAGESQLFSGAGMGQQQSMERQAHMVAMAAAAMLRTRMQQEEEQCPGLRLLGKHPAGRPMRSLSEGNLRSAPTGLSALLDAEAAEDSQRRRTRSEESLAASGDAAGADMKAVMDKMRSRTKDEDDLGDDDSSDDEEPKKKKPKKEPKPTDEEPKEKRKKDKRKDPETPRPKAAKTTPQSVAKAKWPRKPCIGFEHTRKQVMCKSGKGGPRSTLAMKFADYGGKQKALV